MAKVLMRCPTKGKEFDTGLEVPRKVGLKSLSLGMVKCPHCDHYHYLRLPYYLGDEPADKFDPADGLETAPAFAMEVGIIIASAAFMESYVPQIFAKVSGMSSGHAVMTFGAFPSIGTKIQLLQVLRDLQPKDAAVRKHLSALIKKFRQCAEIRDHYAHAKYHYGGGDHITMLPYFGDSKKRKESISVDISKIRADAEFLRQTKYMIRDYIKTGTMPRS